MDFIERFFGVAPDGGDGTTELLYVLAFLSFICAARYRSSLLKLLFRSASRKATSG